MKTKTSLVHYVEKKYYGIKNTMVLKIKIEYKSYLFFYKVYNI